MITLQVNTFNKDQSTLVFFCVIMKRVKRNYKGGLSMSFISKALGFKSEMMGVDSSIIDLNDFCYKLEEVNFHRLALETAIDLIGNAVARVDWNHFENRKIKDSILTTTLNGSPNQLQTSTEFFKTMVRTLLLNGEVLILELDNNLYVADQFQRNFKDFKTVTYSAITINGYDTPQKIYPMSQAIYLSMSDTNLRTYLESYMQKINELTSSSMTAYMNNKTRRFVISSDLVRANLTDVQKEFNEMMEKQLASFISSNKPSAIYAKPKNSEIVDMSDKNFIQMYDTRGILEDIFKTVANTFHIPPEYMLGGQLNQIVVDNFLVNAVYPIVDLFKEGFNNHQFSELERRNGTLVKADTSKSRIVDLKTIGTFVAQVFPTGAITLNDVATKYLQLDELPEDIRDIRVITKNYSELEQFVDGETHDQALGELESEEVKETTTLNKFLGGK